MKLYVLCYVLNRKIVRIVEKGKDLILALMGIHYQYGLSDRR